MIAGWYSLSIQFLFLKFFNLFCNFGLISQAYFICDWLYCFILYCIVQKVFRTLTVEIKRLNSVNSGKLLTTLGEASKGLVLIRYFNKQRYILKEFLEKLNESLNTNVISQALQIWMSIRLLFISNLIFISVSVIHVVLLFLDYQMQYTTVAMCITYSMLFSQKFTEVVRFFSYVEINIVSVESIRQYFENKIEDLDGVENQESTQINQNVEVQIQQIKKLQNLDTVYKIQEKLNQCPSLKEENLAVLMTFMKIKKEKIQVKKQLLLQKEFPFQLKKEKKQLFVVEQVQGKLLFQMCCVKINGNKIQNYSLKSLRSKMSVIPQSGFLYNASLKDNIDPEGKISNEYIFRKLNQTNLSLSQKDKINNEAFKNSDKDHQEQFQDEEMNFIGQLQGQSQEQIDLSFEIKEGGSNLSNGEKQIINFFRIVMRESEIICLDEATSNMDPKTDQEIHKQIFDFAKDKTLIMITHRLENIDQFDRVVVLEEGRIVECGKVTDLRQIQGGFFNKLIHDQEKTKHRQLSL